MMATVERRRRHNSHPDPRLILSRSGRLPYHLAARHGHRDVLEWLDPSIPLMFLLSSAESVADGSNEHRIGVPRLAVLASKALHAALMSDLEKAERERDEQIKLFEQQRAEREARDAAKEREKLSKTLKGRIGAMLGGLTGSRRNSFVVSAEDKKAGKRRKKGSKKKDEKKKDLLGATAQRCVDKD